MKKYFKKTIAIVLVFITIMACGVPAFAADRKTMMGYYASAETSFSKYSAGQGINRVFYLTTGKTNASRTLSLSQKAGSLSYSMGSPRVKNNVYQSYDIFVYNQNARKGTTYNWDWSKNKTIKLDKNTSYVITIYPAGISTVAIKYLSFLQRVCGYYYVTSPYYTISTVGSIRYSASDSLKIAYVK